jgi:broad specificity phosphatase PhoE
MSKDSTTKTIFMFRHGETDWNAQGRMQGGTDIPLNEKGRSQAEVLRQFFEQNPVDVMLTSDLNRARETAEIARGQLPIPIVVEARLRETNLGKGEGLTVPEFVAQFGAQVLEDWRKVDRFFDDVRMPGGESKTEHRTRFIQGLEDFLHSPQAAPHTRIGVATHGGSMRRFIHHLCPHLVEGVSVSNCVTYQIRYSLEKREWTVDLNPVVSPVGSGHESNKGPGIFSSSRK